MMEMTDEREYPVPKEVAYEEYPNEHVHAFKRHARRGLELLTQAETALGQAREHMTDEDWEDVNILARNIRDIGRNIQLAYNRRSG